VVVDGLEHVDDGSRVRAWVDVDLCVAAALNELPTF
jgi:hypothetical protein